jgi:hypothetical protein
MLLIAIDAHVFNQLQAIAVMAWKPGKRKLLTAKWLEDGRAGKTGLIGGL